MIKKKMESNHLQTLEALEVSAWSSMRKKKKEEIRAGIPGISCKTHHNDLNRKRSDSLERCKLNKIKFHITQ